MSRMQDWHDYRAVLRSAPAPMATDEFLSALMTKWGVGRSAAMNRRRRARQTGNRLGIPTRPDAQHRWWLRAPQEALHNATCRWIDEAYVEAMNDVCIGRPGAQHRLMAIGTNPALLDKTPFEVWEDLTEYRMVA